MLNANVQVEVFSTQCPSNAYYVLVRPTRLQPASSTPELLESILAYQVTMFKSLIQQLQPILVSLLV